MLKSSLCDYSDAYTLVRGTITITWEATNVPAKQTGKINKGVIFKSYAPCTHCISEIYNTQINISCKKSESFDANV